MKNVLGALLITVLLGFSSCENWAGVTLDKVGLTNEIEERFSAFVNHMNKLDAEELKDFYSNDDRFYWVEDGQIQYENKSTLAASLDGLVGMLSSSDMKVLGTRVEVISESSAMLFAEYEQAMTMTSGGGFDINGAMTVQLQKEEGIWRFLIGHSSTKKQRGG